MTHDDATKARILAEANARRAAKRRAAPITTSFVRFPEQLVARVEIRGKIYVCSYSPDTKLSHTKIVADFLEDRANRKRDVWTRA